MILSYKEENVGRKLEKQNGKGAFYKTHHVNEFASVSNCD